MLVQRQMPSHVPFMLAPALTFMIAFFSSSSFNCYLRTGRSPVNWKPFWSLGYCGRFIKSKESVRQTSNENDLPRSIQCERHQFYNRGSRAQNGWWRFLLWYAIGLSVSVRAWRFEGLLNKGLRYNRECGMRLVRTLS